MPPTTTDPATDAAPDPGLLSTGRLEAFSDGVFAIAITLLVLELRVPERTDHLASDLLRLWPSYVAYGISGLLIGLVWANHHVMTEHVRAADRVLLFLNTLLLLNVSALPFVASLLAAAFREGAGERTAVVVYGGWLALGGVFFNAFWAWVRRGHRLLGDSITPSEAALVGRRFVLGPVLYAAGAALGAAVPVAGVVVFAALILGYWLPPLTRRAARAGRRPRPRPRRPGRTTAPRR